jgi:hypothetical protein
VTPFWEWKEYLIGQHGSLPAPIADEKKIRRLKQDDFAFVKEMQVILQAAQSSPLPIERTSEELIGLSEKQYAQLKKMCPELSQADIHHLVSKLCRLHWAEIDQERLLILEGGKEWLLLDQREQAISLYRHPLNGLEVEAFSSRLSSDKTLREAEKSIARVASGKWVAFEEFFKGLAIPLHDEQAITLQKCGRSWRYKLPEYSEEEIDFFTAVISEWLFVVGMTALGEIDGKKCFSVTSLGQELFTNE